MGKPKENVAKAEKLIAIAKQKEKCPDKVKAVENAIENLKDAAEFSFGEWITVLAASAGAIVGAILTGGWGAIALLGLGGLADLGVGASYLERVKKANEKLEKAIKELEICLKQ